MGRFEEKIGKKHLTPDELEHRALTLRALGWLLLAFDSIIAVFIFVGFRSGSDLWFFWTVIEGMVGIGLIAAGRQRENQANRAMAEQVRPHLPSTGDSGESKAA